MLFFGPGREQHGLFIIEMERLATLVRDMERIHRGVPPQVLAGDDALILDRWILAGLSTGHPELVGENRLIGTSDLWLLSKDHTWAWTLSRWYRLGRPAERTGLNA